MIEAAKPGVLVDSAVRDTWRHALTWRLLAGMSMFGEDAVGPSSAASTDDRMSWARAWEAKHGEDLGLPAPGAMATIQTRWARDVLGRSDSAEGSAEVWELLGWTARTVQDFLERRLGAGVVADRALLFDWFLPPDDGKTLAEVTAEEFEAGFSARLEVVGGAELLATDALLAELLEELGQPEWAAEVRATKVEDRGARWQWRAASPDERTRVTPKACKAVHRAVRARVLGERARAAKEAEESKHRRAAITRGVVLTQLLPAMTGQLQLIDDKAVRNERGRKVGVIVVDGQTTLEVVRSGLALLGSEHGHVLINTLVHRAFDAYEAGEHDARRVAFAGGWRGLAEAIGYGEPTYDKLQAIVRGGGAVEWTTPHGTAGGLWTWTATRGNASQRGEVAFVLGDTLMPGLAAALSGPGAARTLSAREARRLCPEPRFRPPTHMVRPNERGPVWTLARLVMLEFVDNAEELSQTGSIAVPLERWRQLYAQARLPWATHEKVHKAWLEGESEAAPALLAEVETGRFDLAKPHELEAAFLREQGKRRMLGRGGGKDGATKKQAATVVAGGAPKKRSRKK